MSYKPSPRSLFKINRDDSLLVRHRAGASWTKVSWTSYWATLPTRTDPHDHISHLQETPTLSENASIAARQTT